MRHKDILGSFYLTATNRNGSQTRSEELIYLCGLFLKISQRAFMGTKCMVNTVNARTHRCGIGAPVQHFPADAIPLLPVSEALDNGHITLGDKSPTVACIYGANA